MSTDQRNDDLRLDYNETTDLMRSLTDVRFKLVAFVPTISGAAIAVLGHGKSTAELLAVGLLGLVATVGIVIFDLRNTQLLDYAVLRAKSLEERLGFVSIFEPGSPAARTGMCRVATALPHPTSRKRTVRLPVQSARSRSANMVACAQSSSSTTIRPSGPPRARSSRRRDSSW